MTLPRTTRIRAGQPEKFATSGDFCRLFVEEMSSLYQLSFLLTGDHEKAEQCFVAGLEDSVKENLVFKEWATAWAKRMIVVNAIRMIAPRNANVDRTWVDARLDPLRRGAGTAVELVGRLAIELDDDLPIMRDKRGMIEGVLELADFDRFAFVMSILERSPIEDCSALLDCSLQEFREARTRALVQVAQSCARREGSGVEALTH